MTNTSFLGGATSKSCVVRAITISTGLPKTDLAYNTATIVGSYWRAGANAAVSITLATQTVSGAYSSGGFVHIANGVYRFDIPDAAIAASADFVAFAFSGVADCFITGCHIDILGVDPRSATAVSADVTKWNGTAVASSATAGYPAVTIKVGTATGELDLASGKAPATIAAGDIANNAITAAAVATGAIDADALATDAATEIANAVVEAEITALLTYSRPTNTTGTITGPTSGSNALGITVDAAYTPIKTL